MELYLTILLPFAGGILLVFIPPQRHTAIRYVSMAVATASLILSIIVFLLYDFEKGGFQLAQSFVWLGEPLNISLSLGIDGIAAPMVLLTGIVLFAAILVSWNIDHRPKDYFVLLMMLVTGVYGVFLARDIFFLFFFYELAVLPMYLLIGVWGSSSDFGTFLRTKEYGALKLVLYLVAGSVFIWIAILALYWASAQSGTPSFSMETLQTVNFDTEFRHFQTIVFALLMIGFGILAGLWPFHTWSPDGHVAAPTAVSMLHAGVLMKLGAYGIIRVGMTLLPEGANNLMPILIGLGTVNVIYGAISAMGQKDLKYVVGYSSVSHMGYVLMGLATLNQLGVSGAVLQMFSHGIMTALMFAMVGVIYGRTHERNIEVFEGLSKRMGTTSILFSIAGLASLGLPGLSGFIAEFLVFLGVFKTYPLLGAIAVIGAAITAVYILKLISKAFMGPLNPKWQHVTDANTNEIIAGSMLALTLVFVGIWPIPLMDVINTGVSAIPGVA